MWYHKWHITFEKRIKRHSVERLIMNGFAKALVTSWILLFVVALLPLAAFADDGNAPDNQVAAGGANSALQAGTLEGETVTHSAHVALIQEGAVPSAAEAGTPWDGMKAKSGSGTTESDGSSLLSQAINPVDTAKSRILKALLEVRQGKIDLSDCEIPSNDISSIYASAINSSPDLFYVSGSMSWSSQYTSNGTFIVTSITPSYNYDVETIKNQMKPAYNSAFRELLSWVPEGAGPIEKAKSIHDWLVRNCAYNTDAANQGYYGYGSKNPWEAYGALVDRRPVCQGYALAFKAAMNTLGVPCGYLIAHNHGWNIIQVNGSWFHVDATFDDPLPDGGFSSVHTEYFMKSDWKAIATDQARGQYVHADWTQNYHAYDTTYDGWTTGWWPSYSGPAYASTLTSFSLNASSMWMRTDSKSSLYITSMDPASYGAHRAKWVSSNRSVVDVDSAGNLVSGSKAGTASIGCILGTHFKYCTITVRESLDNARVSIPKRSYAYTGSAIKPIPKVVLNGTTLVRDKDYTVTYENNTNRGTAKVMVRGKGFYIDGWDLKFTITNPSLANATMASVKNRTYTGKAFKPTPKVTWHNKTLKKGTDYTLSYKNNKNAGTATVIATGKGLYTGTVSKSFKIKKAGKNSAKVATTHITKKFKASKRTKRLSATKTVILPKVTTKFGKAKWKVVTKDPRGVLSLKSGKVKVKKGAKRRTYKIELKATVKKTSSYKGASTEVVTVRVKVK